PDAAAPENATSTRSVLEYWREMDSTGTVEPVAGAGQVDQRRIVTGPPWLRAWGGPGWASPELVVRACDPTPLALPPEVGRATTAIAALDPSGTYVATLVATDDTRIEPLGQLSRQETLIGVRTTGRSLVAAWEPSTGRLATVILINADTSVSVADILLPLGSGP
ncbi:MAG: hypothetical protein IRY85_12705, partial [Micromonosporaceae bacterium]|nr:hypothetical protein [Micromonosporaceae bacterium]